MLSDGTIVLGSDLGVLARFDAAHREATWQTTPVYIGTNKEWTYEAPSKAMLGPQLMTATASFDVAGIGKTEIRLMSHSTLSDTGRDLRLLVYGLHWTAWDPLD